MQLSNMPYQDTLECTTLRKSLQCCVIYMKLLVLMTRVEWMKGICHMWSRGRLISPSLLVGDDWYLNLSSQKRSPGRNLGEHRSVRRSGTASRGTVVLVFCLRMRSFSRTEVLTIFLRKDTRVGPTKLPNAVDRSYSCQFTSTSSKLTRRQK